MGRWLRSRESFHSNGSFLDCFYKHKSFNIIGRERKARGHFFAANGFGFQKCIFGVSWIPVFPTFVWTGMTRGCRFLRFAVWFQILSFPRMRESLISFAHVSFFYKRRKNFTVKEGFTERNWQKQPGFELGTILHIFQDKYKHQGERNELHSDDKSSSLNRRQEKGDKGDGESHPFLFLPLDYRTSIRAAGRMA